MHCEASDDDNQWQCDEQPLKQDCSSLDDGKRLQASKSTSTGSRPQVPFSYVGTKSRRTEYTASELADLRSERLAAELLEVPWQRRGPPGPKDGGPQQWRGQKFRESTGKWANRGGQWRDYYNSKYGAKGRGKGKGKSKTKPRPDPHTAYSLWSGRDPDQDRGGPGVAVR